jgi:transcriptional regulator with XRE-family HTH domain
MRAGVNYKVTTGGDAMINGKKIRELREAEKLTVVEFAEKVYTSHSMIVHIENGVKKPSVDLLKRIADYFGLKMDELMITVL